MDVASWLRSLGLEQYEATFRDNAIDGSVQPDLTDQDLESSAFCLATGIRRLSGRRCATLGHCRANPRQAAASSRTACSGLRVVH